MFYCCLIVLVFVCLFVWFDLAERSRVADVSLFFKFAYMIKYRGQLRGSYELFQTYGL